MRRRRRRRRPGHLPEARPDRSTKTPDALNINAGEDVVFDITVTNATAPARPRASKLSDPLPGGVAGDWALVGPDADAAYLDTTDPQPDDLDCTFGDLASVRLEDGHGQDRDHRLRQLRRLRQHRHRRPRPIAPNGDRRRPGHLREARPHVDKTPDAQNINAGEDVVFDITVTNNGRPAPPRTSSSATRCPARVAGTWAGRRGADAADMRQPDPVGATLDCTFGDLGPRWEPRRRSRSRPRHQLRQLRRLRQHRDSCDRDQFARTATDDGQVTCEKPDLDQSTRPPTPRPSTPARTWSSTSRSPTATRGRHRQGRRS